MTSIHIFSKVLFTVLLQGFAPSLSAAENSYPMKAKLVKSLIYASLPLGRLSMVIEVQTLILPCPIVQKNKKNKKIVVSLL